MSSYDARERGITWFTAHDVAANITEDNGTIPANIIHQFEKPQYPAERIYFGTKNVDGIYTWETPTTEALIDWKKEGYAYEETTPIYISAVDKQGITGDKLQWKMAKELRRIAETYPEGSIRTLTRVGPVDLDFGVWKQHAIRYNLMYKRAAEDYTSDVTISYGNGWQYDGDRVDNGVEGQWGDGSTAVDVDGGSTVTQNHTTNPGALTFNLTVFVGDAYSKNATNLGLSTTTYTKIRFRYKTTGAATAKIVVGDDAAYSQTVMSETASSTWTTASVSLTTGKTLDHVSLYCCDGVGTVQYDFVQIYQDDFTFPNVTDIKPSPEVYLPNLGIPSSIGLGLQYLGEAPLSLEVECDLDMETTTYSWTPTGYTTNDEIFGTIRHNQSSYPWNWFSWGDRGCRVSIESAPYVEKSGMMTLRLKEYRDIEGSTETYVERFDV